MRKSNKREDNDEAIVASLPASAAETIPAVHTSGQITGNFGSQDAPHDFSAAAFGRADTIPCAKRSFWRDTLVVRVVHQPMSG